MNIQELGRRVKERRQELQLSQENLAERAGISRNYLSIIERGEARNISTGVLNQLADALELTSAELSGDSPLSDILIPPSLRQFSLAEGLSFSVVDWLARMPRRGPEPKTVDEWRQLYDVVRQYIEDED